MTGSARKRRSQRRRLGMRAAACLAPFCVPALHNQTAVRSRMSAHARTKVLYCATTCFCQPVPLRRLFFAHRWRP